MPAATLCSVCGETSAAAGVPLSECADCGGWFHLELSRDSRLPSCGAATFGPACGFSFSCNRCIERMEQESGTSAGGGWRSVVR